MARPVGVSVLALMCISCVAFHFPRGSHIHDGFRPTARAMGSWDSCSPPMSRSDVLRALVAATLLARPGCVVSAEDPKGKVTSKVFFDVKIASYAQASVDDYTGRLVFGLFGEDSPKSVASFLRFVEGNPLTEPSYMGTSLSRVVDGKYVDLGHIPRVNVFSLAGSQELEFNGRIIPDSEFALEENDFVHDRRGLLSRARFSVVPDFCITLMPCPQLDFSHVVFGDLIGGTDVLKQIEKVPLYTYRSTEQEGSLADLWFQKQREFFVQIGKNVLKDERATDLRGKFLRRIDVIRCGVL